MASESKPMVSLDGAYIAASLALMTIGGGVAWGVGGILFAGGLWLTLALVSDEIIRSRAQ
jgi:hypothetical protein